MKGFFKLASPQLPPSFLFFLSLWFLPFVRVVSGAGVRAPRGSDGARGSTGRGHHPPQGWPGTVLHQPPKKSCLLAKFDSMGSYPTTPVSFCQEGQFHSMRSGLRGGGRLDGLRLGSLAGPQGEAITRGYEAALRALAEVLRREARKELSPATHVQRLEKPRKAEGQESSGSGSSEDTGEGA